MDQLSCSRLQTFYGQFDALQLLSAMINDEFKGQVAVSSSFGAQSALLLALVAEVNPKTPVLFLDTQKHFPETLAYVEQLRELLKLEDVRMLKPDPDMATRTDPDGGLWNIQPNRCCWLRKVEPLDRHIAENGISAMITGRKAYQTRERAEMHTIELDDKNIYKINPLTRWSKEQIATEFERRNLPEHPLVAQGFLSIGCAPCTRSIKPGEDERAGRWAHTATFPGGEQKQECGLHVDTDATVDWTI